MLIKNKVYLIKNMLYFFVLKTKLIKKQKMLTE